MLYATKFNKNRLIRLSSGTTFPEISKSNISQVRIPCPTAIQEQQKIASILSKVDELIQKTDQIIEQTQKLKKGLMQRLFTKGIGDTLYKKTKIGEIPNEWKVAKLGDIAVVSTGSTPSTLTKEYYKGKFHL